MKVGDLIEAHKGQRGVILEIELMYPGNKYSPPRAALIHWLDEAPHWHIEGRCCHVSGIKKVISSTHKRSIYAEVEN